MAMTADSVDLIFTNASKMMMEENPTNRKQQTVVDPPQKKTKKDDEENFAFGMSFPEFCIYVFDYAFLGTVLFSMARDEGRGRTFMDNFSFHGLFKQPFIYILFHLAWYITDIHKRWGFWKTTEPRSHLIFSMKTIWIGVTYTIGFYLAKRLCHVSNPDVLNKTFDVNFRFTKEQLGSFSFFLAPAEPTTMQNLLMTFLIFYTVDFWRYWVHRWGHIDILYRTFPVSHAHHHNQVFINPWTFMISPMVHFATYATLIPCALGCGLGWVTAARKAWMICHIPNITQHMGFDPFPWLTRWNHKYFMGAIPWIPLHHSYHHLHIVKPGNFGNTTVFFDYVFGTVTPESVYHIENGEPTPFIKKFFSNPELDKVFELNFEGARKNRLDLNY